MKKIVCLVVLLCFGLTADAAQRVNGYVKRNGTYVAPHYRSASDSNRYNNYSTRGNYNPYTGSKGYKNPYKPSTNSYSKRRYY